MTILDTLTKARDLLSDPNKWIKRSIALNGCGAPCDAASPHARQFCMIGAIHHVAGNPGQGGSAQAYLEMIIGEAKSPFRSVSGFNDHPTTTHQDVLNFFSVAIAAELNRENKS